MEVEHSYTRRMPHIALPPDLPGITSAFAFRPETAKPMRELAEVLGASVLEIDADHDAPLARGDEYRALTQRAVDTVTAGLTPGR